MSQIVESRQPLNRGEGQYIKCHYCTRPAIAFFGNRTDGRNGFVCPDHFNESGLVQMTPHDDPWLTYPVS